MCNAVGNALLLGAQSSRPRRFTGVQSGHPESLLPGRSDGRHACNRGISLGRPTRRKENTVHSLPVSTVSVLVAALAATTIQPPLPAQVAPSWLQVDNGGPPPRRWLTMAYDTHRDRTVLFGGQASGNVALGDTWEWDGTTWTQVASTGPAPRYWHAMAYDSLRNRTVVFGGRAASGNLGDTWEWDGTSWALLPAIGPSARNSHAMTFDSTRGKTVLFGGFSPYLDDTWEWDGTTWTQVAAGGPPPRNTHAMAYDSHRQRTVLFGGNDATGLNMGDTWEWDGAVWTQAATTGPSDRRYHAMAFDSQRQRIVLFGGRSLATTNLADTWEWDGTVWTQVVTPGPAPRRQHGMAYDSQRFRTVLFGGRSSFAGYTGDTWEYALPPGIATTYGNGCGSPALALTPAGNSVPTLGTTAQLALTNIPAGLAFVAIGWSDTAAGPWTLPYPLTTFGMPGCDLLQSAELTGVPVAPSGPGSAVYSLALPNWASLIGVQIYLQGWALAPGANPADIIVSNGVEWVLGNP